MVEHAPCDQVVVGLNPAGCGLFSINNVKDLVMLLFFSLLFSLFYLYNYFHAFDLSQREKYILKEAFQGQNLTTLMFSPFSTSYFNELKFLP